MTRQTCQRCKHGAPSYQANDHDQRLAPRHAFLDGMELEQAVAGADGGTPVHSGDGASKHHGAADSLPPDDLPCRLKDKEEGQGGGAGRHGNEGGANDVADLIRGLVVADGRIGQVVHAADGTAGQQAGEGYSPPADPTVDADGEKGQEKDQDGDEQRQDGHAGRVGDLQVFAPVEDIDGSISDKVLCRRQLGRGRRHRDGSPWTRWQCLPWTWRHRPTES